MLHIPHKIYDVCIVGSGPAGAFAARELSNKGIETVVIEAGGKNVALNPSNVVDLENNQISGSIDFGFSQQFGGSSNVWAGGLARLNKADLSKREIFGFHGWPIKVNELNELYDRVNSIIGIKKTSPEIYRAEEGLQYSDIEYREMIVLNKPFCTSKLIEESGNITLLQNCMAIKLKKHNELIESILVYNKETKQHFDVRAKYFIIAAGSLTNIRILLHSFKDFTEELPELYDNIGRYFSTHPKANIGFFKPKKTLTDNHPFSFRKAYSGFDKRYQFGLSEKCLIENDLLNHCLRFNSSFNQRLSRVFEKVKSIVIKLFGISRSENIFVNAIAYLGVVVYRLIDSLRCLSFSQKKLSVRVFLDQSSSKYNQVLLSKKLAESGLPLAFIKWNYNDKDWNNVEKFIFHFNEQLNKSGLGELVYVKPNELDYVGIHSHFIGGTRIGESSLDSVVNSDLKVHGIQNLFISGPSVFPSFGYANPFYTIAALSLRLSDHLLSIFIENKSSYKDGVQIE